MCAQVSNHCVAEEERPSKRLRARDGDDQARIPQAESHHDPCELDMILRERRRMLASARRAYKHAVDAGSFQPTLRCVEELLKPVYPELYYAVAAVAHSNIDGVPTRRQSELDRARERRAIASLVHMLEASSQRVHFLEDEFSLMLLTAGENARRAADGTGMGRGLSAWYDMKSAILRDIDAHTYAWAMKRLLECSHELLGSHRSADAVV